MQTEPMNVDTKNMSCAETLELAIAETRLALAQYGDMVDAEFLGHENTRFLRIEGEYQKVDAGLDRCKAAADGLAAYSRVLEMANNAAGERLRSQRAEITHLFSLRGECNAEIDRLEMEAKAAQRTVQDLQAQHYDRQSNLTCAAVVVGLMLLGAAIEAANGLLGRLL